MKSKKNPKSQGTRIVALFSALIVVVVFGVLYLPSRLFNTTWGWPAICEWFSGGGVAGTGTQLVVDVDRKAFAMYSDYVGDLEAITITIYSTTDEFDVRAMADKGYAYGTARFLVTPKQYLFSTTDIEERVREGLSSEYSSPNPPNGQLWKSWAIETNGVNRTWSVVLSGVAGEGTIRLTIGKASDVFPVSLPNLFPIWRFVRYADSRSGIVRINGFDLKKGEVLTPDLARNLCGYKVHSISNQTVWFEAVYSTPNPAITRTRWPDVRIDYRELDNGQSNSVIVFEGGDVMKPGEIAVLDEHGLRDSLKLDADSFKSDRAVLFRYRDRNDQSLADMIAVTFQ